MGVNIAAKVERLALRQRIDGFARLDRIDDDLRNRLHRAESGVALILGPEQHIQILWPLIGDFRRRWRADWKSVGSGKNVSVRVHLSGWRLLKKKKYTQP